MKPKIFLLAIGIVFLRVLANDSFAQSIYAPAPVKQVKVALVLVDPPVRSNPSMRWHTYFSGKDPWGQIWRDPLVLANRLRDSLNAFSHGVLNYTFEYIYDDTVSCTRMEGNIISSDSMFVLLSDPGWATLNAKGTDYDYRKLLNQYNFCDKRDSNLIHEVWVYAVPNFGAKWESCMAGINAFWINGPVITGTTCADLLPVMGFNLARDVDLAMHSYGHRFESTMAHVYGRWNYSAANPNNWERFSSYDKVWPGSAHCGNVHFPPNALNDYEYGNTNSVYTFADVWMNYPNLAGHKKQITCTEWKCNIYDELTYFSWWYRHIPYFDCVNPDSKDRKLNNWWHYVVDYREAVKRASNFNNLTLNCMFTGVNTQVNILPTFDVFPNPSSGKFTIEGNGEQEMSGKMEIYNVLGKKVYTELVSASSSTIDLSSEPQGIYFVQIISDSTIYTQKIIIQ